MANLLPPLPILDDIANMPVMQLQAYCLAYELPIISMRPSDMRDNLRRVRQIYQGDVIQLTDTDRRSLFDSWGLEGDWSTAPSDNIAVVLVGYALSLAMRYNAIGYCRSPLDITNKKQKTTATGTGTCGIVVEVTSRPDAGQPLTGTGSCNVMVTVTPADIIVGGMLLSCLPASNALCDPSVLGADPQVTIGSYRQNHSQLQQNAPANGITSDPTDPSWNWAYFDSAVQQAEQLGTYAFLRVLFQAGNAPSWVTANAQQFIPAGGGGAINIWWDSYFQSAVTAVIQAMGARYGSNPVVKAVSFNIVSQGSGDWSFPHGTANWQNSAAFNVPAVGATVNVTTTVSGGMGKNQWCYIPGAGWFQATQASGTVKTVLINNGTTGNAAPGTTVPANTTIVVNDIQTLQTIYGYTTAKLVGAETGLASVIATAFPNAMNDQEVGRNGTMDPYPPLPANQPGPVQQSMANATGSNPYSGTYPKAVTAGNTLLVAFTWNAATGSVTSFLDNVNNAQWTRVAIIQGNARSLVLYQYTNTLGGTPTVTVTLSATQGTLRMAFWELPGSTVFAETPGTASGALTTTVTTPTIVPGTPNDWVLAVLLGGNPVSAGGAGWSGFQSLNTLASQYIVPGNTAPLSAQFTQASSTYVTIIVAFNGVGNPPGPSYQYNAATQIAQAGYKNAANFCIGKNTVQTGNPPPSGALAQLDGADLYLPAQTLAGSSNTSATTGVIPANSDLFLQALWVAYDASGAYSPTSTTPPGGGFQAYCQNGGVPYNAATVNQVVQNTILLMKQYKAKIAEIYQDDLKHCMPVPY